MFALATLAAFVSLNTEPPPPPSPINLDSLLAEMFDRESLARFPDPPYTCKQFSSYDRASKSPDDPATWFANGDRGEFLRTENVGEPPRKEWVMADMDGPGVIVRLWSANPKGTLRIYLDDKPTPAIEAPMADVLGGKWKIPEPMSGVQSRGYNLFLPIPYAKHCKVTSDASGFYYHVNYRTYPAGTPVESLARLDRAKIDIARVAGMIGYPRPVPDLEGTPTQLPPGAATEIFHSETSGPGEITSLALHAFSTTLTESLRSTILIAEFDGQQTIWCPLSDFFGSGVGLNPYQDWYRTVSKPAAMRSDWVMPYLKSAKLSLLNLGPKPSGVLFKVTSNALPEGAPTNRLMHFHTNWHAQYPIHALGGKGTMDWNYITATGKGVYVGDSLAVMNPVEEWWGEGDEKIYVDGETFPSHFGTGTEDYYGYAWCDPHYFTHPFHAQPRVDGNGKNNWGHTTVSRVRSLDAIPFTKSLRFDMEIWHWAECDEAYAATTYWYALPGATSNIPPQPDEAKAPIPQPPPLPKPLAIPNAIECETMTVSAKSDGVIAAAQDMEGFARQTWSGGAHLWIQAHKPGDFVELTIPVEASKPPGPHRLTLYATKSWDYATVRFTINGKLAGPNSGEPIDLYSGQHGKPLSTGPIELGTFTPTPNGTLLLRAEITGANPKSEPPKTYFGLDCIVATPAPH